jgi:hypothetical protein
MRKRVLLALILAACDPGSVLEESGAQPDASAGGGGGGGSGSGNGSGSGSGGDTASLTITLTANPTAGAVYAPDHVLAVWIQNQGGTFVKTVARYADVRKGSLVAWTQAAGANDVDAVSGATRGSYAMPAEVTWNLRDRQNAVIPDGTYTIRMENADVNATTPNQNNQGTFTFVKGAQPQAQTGLSNGGFTNVSIQFTP